MQHYNANKVIRVEEYVGSERVIRTIKYDNNGEIFDIDFEFPDRPIAYTSLELDQIWSELN